MPASSLERLRRRRAEADDVDSANRHSAIKNHPTHDDRMSEEEGRLIDSALALPQVRPLPPPITSVTSTTSTTSPPSFPSSAGGLGAPASIDDDLAAWKLKESNGTEVPPRLPGDGGRPHLADALDASAAAAAASAAATTPAAAPLPPAEPHIRPPRDPRPHTPHLYICR